jgi:hypothetical protein
VRSRNACAIVFGLLPTASCLLDWDSVKSGYGGDGSTMPSDAGDAAPKEACTPQLVINELKADGTSPSDEYVEIYNLSACAAPLTGYTLYYSSAAGSAPFLIWTGTDADTIDGNGYFILCGDGFTPAGMVHYARWQNLMSPPNGILSKNGGGVGLFDAQQKAIDGVAYATLMTTTHPFIHPKTLPDGGPAIAAPNPPTGQSISRLPNGSNSDVNAIDFKVTANMTPGAQN